MMLDALKKDIRKTAAVAFLVVYFVGGMLTLLVGDRDKSFPPFFNWFLFSRVPNLEGENSYELRIYAVGEEELSSPIPFRRAGPLVREPFSNRARILMLDVGRLYDEGATQAADDARMKFEAAYLFPSTTYDVVKVRYRPLDAFQDRQIEVVEVIGTYSTL